MLVHTSTFHRATSGGGCRSVEPVQQSTDSAAGQAHTHTPEVPLLLLLLLVHSHYAVPSFECGGVQKCKGQKHQQASVSPDPSSHTHTHPVSPDPSSIPRSLESPQGAQERNVQGGFLSSWVTLPFLPAPTVLLAGQDNELEQRDATPQDSPISTIRVQCV